MPKTKRDKAARLRDLRRLAEKRLAGKRRRPGRGPSPESRKLIHELQTHQVELEMQNEELQRSQEQLEEAQAKYESLYDRAPVGYLTLGPDWVIKDVNLKVCELLAGTADRIVGRRWTDFVDPRDQDKCYLCRKTAMHPSETQVCELRLLRAGEPFWVDGRCSVLEGDGGTKAERRVVIADATPRKEAEKKLEEALARMQDLYDNSPDMCASVDARTGRIICCNKTMADHLGYAIDEMAGRPILDLYAPESRKDAERAFKIFLETGRVRNAELVLLGVNKGRISVILNADAVRDKRGKVVESRSTLRDISDRIKAEEYRSRAQKLESLGVLAGGIAHDFNNFLTGVIGNISLAKTVRETGPELTALLDECLAACATATSLARQLLTFGRGGAPMIKPIALSPLLKEAASFAMSGSKSRCEFTFSPALSPVKADREQLAQVIGNLVINANQAMPLGGLVTVEAGNASLYEGEVPGLGAGPYVRLLVRDQGAGIPSEHLDRIFDPYFSTKAEGRGLGLATCHSIINRHGGRISVSSLPGTGTVFEILLPAAEDGEVVEKKPPSSVVKRSGRILIMDDDLVVARILSRILKSLGYEHETAADGKTALKAYRQAMRRKRPFAAVIFDLTVPGGMGGKEAVVELRKLDPKAKAIVSSGYSEDPVLSDFPSYGFAGSLAKPYTREEVSAVLHRVLKRPSDRR